MSFLFMSPKCCSSSGASIYVCQVRTYVYYLQDRSRAHVRLHVPLADIVAAVNRGVLHRAHYLSQLHPTVRFRSTVDTCTRGVNARPCVQLAKRASGGGPRPAAGALSACAHATSSQLGTPCIGYNRNQSSLQVLTLIQSVYTVRSCCALLSTYYY